MSAVRLARGFTGRNKVIKFDGCYHGHSDLLLVNAGSGALETTGSGSIGVSPEIVRDTLSIPFNDRESMEAVIKKYRSQIACVLIEPVPANMGVILPDQGYLEYLRKLTREENILLIFDEVITGFRLTPGGAQEYFGVTPDLTTLGKIIGGGFPAGAFGGRKEIMDCLAPDGGVYQAGTLSGNPVVMSAGYETVSQLIKNRSVYSQMETLMKDFTRELSEVSGLTVNTIGSMFTLFYTTDRVRGYQDALKQSIPQFQEIFSRSLDAGCYLPPSPYEAAFISLKHREVDLEKIIRIFKRTKRQK
jgi:glutamate-1-semialdehyde 2,1-aminomutase